MRYKLKGRGGKRINEMKRNEMGEEGGSREVKGRDEKDEWKETRKGRSKGKDTIARGREK